MPEVGEGSPCSSVLIMEIGASPEKTANYLGVSKPEGNVERAPTSLSDMELAPASDTHVS